MRRIKLTKGLWALVDGDDYDWLNKFKWHVQAGYAARSTGHNTFRFMHQDILQTPDGMFSDHRNSNTLDNQRHNLRVCTPAENNANQRKRGGTSSRFKGVYWEPERKKWVCKVMNRKRQRTNIGRFDSEVAAGMAYDLWMLDMYGEFARPNLKPIFTDRLSLEHCQELRRAS